MSDISLVSSYLQELEKSFGKLRDEAMLRRKWFSREDKVFFDNGPDRKRALQELLRRKDLSQFKAIVVVRRGTDHVLKAVTYGNLGNESLEHFIRRFSTFLEQAMALEMQLQGYEYVKCVGFDYVTKEEIETLEKGLVLPGSLA